MLVVSPAGLRYEDGNSNQFVISTTSNGYIYYQVFNVFVYSNISAFPDLTISCHVASFCNDSGAVKIFSASNMMILDGTYVAGSSFIDSVTYAWTVYKNIGGPINQQWATLSTSEKINLEGATSSELTICQQSV